MFNYWKTNVVKAKKFVISNDLENKIRVFDDMDIFLNFIRKSEYNTIYNYSKLIYLCQWLQRNRKTVSIDQ